MRAILPLLALLLTAAAPRPATFANPVLDADFPDPAVLKAPDGFYYAYATQTERNGKRVNLQVARSRDLVRWQWLGDALPVNPVWASHTWNFWAPHAVRHEGRYFLYYSAEPDPPPAGPKTGLCLAVATSTRPEGPFTDIGRPLQCAEGFVNIDPMAFDDPATGRRLLYWGSGFQPIKVRELAPDRLSFAPGSAAVDLLPPEKGKDYQELVEGGWVVRRGGYYYLFYSGNNCCGKDAHYAVMVARSRRAAGPFEKAPRPILAALGRWLAPGHNSVATDRAGRDWIVYHAVDTRRPGEPVNTRRVVLLDRIVWEHGWPRIGGPTEGSQPAPR
ncbi:MAG: arabinan endo,5-alpha-L-arabinosidase [Sphingomonadales bacterium]|jgi:arabinan endo-1,5-alpha-L-arabinosidase|nr:arabinan endo,5-alpha-L-arabinosidase [Sphingomonadales bacterium]